MGRKYSRASDIGRATYCPHSLYLQTNKNVTYSEQTLSARKRGINDHNQLNQTVLQSKYKISWLWKLAIVLIGGAACLLVLV